MPAVHISPLVWFLLGVNALLLWGFVTHALLSLLDGSRRQARQAMSPLPLGDT
jgi:hypothetical protein